MPNYKELYLTLFRANEQAIRTLVQAQRAAEEAVMAASEPPLTLLPCQGPGSGNLPTSAPGPAPQEDEPEQ